MKQMETGRSTVDHEFIRTDDILEMEGLRAELGATERRRLAATDRLSGRTGVCGLGVSPRKMSRSFLLVGRCSLPFTRMGPGGACLTVVV